MSTRLARPIRILALTIVAGLSNLPGLGIADGPATTGPAVQGTGTFPNVDRLAAGPSTRPAVSNVSIYGSRLTDVHRVVLLVDCSGSMIGAFGDLKAKLKKTVSAMNSTDGQKLEFNIITFSDEAQPNVLFKDGPQPATDDNKKSAVDFIDDQVCSGGTQPMTAIKAALATDPPPDGIFLLTDGFDNAASFDDVTDIFKVATKDGNLKVNCVQFVSEPDPDLVKMLKKISEQSHGRFKQIQKSDMQ